jgi:hypothetical protein
MNRGTKALKITGFVILGILALAAFGFVTMYLWNWLVPDWFNGPVITFWQTVGLLILSKILFSGFGKGGGHRGGPWKPYWKERLNRMSPEERERFKQKIQDKWCRPSARPTTNTTDSNVEI